MEEKVDKDETVQAGGWRTLVEVGVNGRGTPPPPPLGGREKRAEKWWQEGKSGLKETNPTNGPYIKIQPCD